MHRGERESLPPSRLESDIVEFLGRSPDFGLSQEARRSLRQGALWALFASLAASALIGIAALASTDFGETEGRLLLTTFSFFGASAITLACGLAWERGRLGIVPVLGIVSGLAGLVLVLVGIWGDFEGDLWWKAFTSEIMVALAATHASLVAVFSAGQRFRWGTYAAYALAAVAVTLTLIAVWGDVSSDGFWRFYGAVLVLLLALTIALPVLRRIAGPAMEWDRRSASARYCPACGIPLEPPGATSCGACGARFSVRIDIPAEAPTPSRG